MAVEVVHVVAVDALAQVGHVLIGGAHVDCVGAGEDAVDMVGGGRTGEQVHLERAAFGMFALGFCGDELCDELGSTGCGETGQSEGVAVLNHFGGFLSRDIIVCHVTDN